MSSAILFILLFLFMLMGIPIAISLGLSSVITIMLFADDSLASLADKVFHTMHHSTLMAIPFFVLASTFLTTGGVARRMISFAVDAVGWLRGGLGMASVLACMLFAAVSGSSPATVVAIGSIVIVGMVKQGYPQPFAAGLICNAGTLGILIPPSIVMVVYAAATEVSVGRMFMAGVLPGLLMGLLLMVAIYIAARKRNLPAQPFAGWPKQPPPVGCSSSSSSWAASTAVSSRRRKRQPYRLSMPVSLRFSSIATSRSNRCPRYWWTPPK